MGLLVFLFTFAKTSFVIAGAHKRREAVIARNSDVLTTAARLWPYLAHSYVTAATEAT